MPQRESWGPEPSDERMRLKSSRPAAGRLVAYDAEHFTNGVIRLIWDSQAEGIPFDFNKFNPPVERRQGVPAHVRGLHARLGAGVR
jgi:hypothetical protein